MPTAAVPMEILSDAAAVVGAAVVLGAAMSKEELTPRKRPKAVAVSVMPLALQTSGSA